MGARRAATLVATAALAALLWSQVGSPAADAPAASAHATSARAHQDRPNVLMLTLDDLSAGDLAAMPRTRRLLAEQGTTLTQGLAPTPICAPARASLLTGQYAHNHRVVTVDGRGGGFTAFKDRRTLPVWLRAAGYDTMFAGKYLNGYGVRNPRYVPPGWNRWRASVDYSTYSFVRTRFNVDGHVVKPHGYSTDILARYTDEMLAQHRHGAQRSRPWFMWVNYVAPHHGGPREPDDPQQHWGHGRDLKTTTPAPRDRNTFRHAQLPRTPAMWEENRQGNPHAGRHAPAAYRAAVREAHQQRLESVQAVDRAVGRTMATLRRTGELGRTVVVLTSDNGFQVGQHNMVGKLWFYDASVRIPIIMRGPGIPRDRKVDTPVANPDLAVTIAALAGARPTRAVDGVDVLPWLSRPDQKRVVPIEAYPVNGGVHRLYSGLRYGDFTYVRSRSGYEELYDRSTDPGELVNVAKRPAYRKVVRQLREWDGKYRDCAGATCPGDFTPVG